MKPIWVVDDDQSIRFVLEKALQREGFSVRCFASPREVLKALEEDAPQVLVSDIRMPGGSGIDLLGAVKQRHPGLPVIIMTAYSDLDSAVSAFQGGAFEYLPKPFDVVKAVELIRRAVEESLREDVADAAQAQMPEMLGQAPAMQDVFRAIGRLSQSNVTVMITGESGTGKELVARALHKHSPRGDWATRAPSWPSIPRPFRRTCSRASSSATSAAPSPAHRPRAAAASSRPTAARCSWTRSATCRSTCRPGCCACLRDGQFYRVGGHQPLKANVRVIAATHQNLEERVRQGNFREDLYHRLNVIRLRLPPLRERREDIPMLTRFFLGKSAKELGVEAKRITDSALARLATFDFPGNVRQLENLCHWLTVMAPAQVVEPKDLPPELLGAPATAAAITTATATAAPGVADAAGTAPQAALAPEAAPLVAPSWLADLEREARRRLEAGETEVWDTLTRQFESGLIRTALELTRGRRIEAAQRLGIGRNTITRKIQELGLED